MDNWLVPCDGRFIVELARERYRAHKWRGRWLVYAVIPPSLY